MFFLKYVGSPVLSITMHDLKSSVSFDLLVNKIILLSVNFNNIFQLEQAFLGYSCTIHGL